MKDKGFTYFRNFCVVRDSEETGLWRPVGEVRDVVIRLCFRKIFFLVIIKGTFNSYGRGRSY